MHHDSLGQHSTQHLKIVRILHLFFTTTRQIYAKSMMILRGIPTFIQNSYTRYIKKQLAKNFAMQHNGTVSSNFMTNWIPAR